MVVLGCPSAFSAVPIPFDAPGPVSRPSATSWQVLGRWHPADTTRGHSVCRPWAQPGIAQGPDLFV